MAKEVAKKEETGAALISDVKPQWLVDLEKKGPVHSNDQFDNSDIVVPKIKLLQGLSKECETFDEAKSGIFWHTGLDMPLGTELNFVVCSRRKRYLLTAPMEDGQGILARADNFVTWDRLGKWQVKLKGIKEPVTWEITDLDVDASGLTKWGSSNPDDPASPPAATLFYEYLVILPEHLSIGPAVISLARSQIKRAKKGLNDKIKLHENAGRPMQAVVFQARPFKDRNENNQDFNNWTFTGNGFASQELYQQAIDLKDALSDYKVANEGEAEEHEVGSGNVESKDF